jgi:hypothetical protein
MGATMQPVNFKTWEHANRQGSYKDWDINLEGGYYKTYVNDYSSYGWNDRISSIDMYYRVY